MPPRLRSCGTLTSVAAQGATRLGKTTWLLTSQTILFAAYGVTFQSTGTADDPSDFRTVVARAGLAIAVITLIGVAALINSKRESTAGISPRPSLEMAGPSNV
jgi:hypothetical protein